MKNALTFVRKPQVLVPLVIVTLLLVWYWWSTRGTKYEDFAAMRYITNGTDSAGNKNHRNTNDPLYYSVGYYVAEKPSFAVGDRVKVVSSAEAPGHAQGEQTVLDIVKEMRTGKPEGWWVATDGAWGSGFGDTTGKVPGKIVKL